MYPKKEKKEKKQLTVSAKILLYLFTAIEILPRPFEGKTHYVRRLFSGRSDYRPYIKILNKLEERGLIRIFKEKEKRYICLTQAGKLEALFLKAQLKQQPSWDRKWRMIVFDIPEDARKQRNKLRFLLKANGYKRIQKSVFINPYPLNREAIRYLQETGLDAYIRIFRIDEADKVAELKKMFSL